MTLLCDQDGLHIGNRVVPIGSGEWLKWLDVNKSFRFECPHHNQPQGGFTRVDTANFSAIKQGNYWQARKKISSRLRREHLGKAETLTYELMRETACRICSNQYWESYRAEKRSRVKSHKNRSETLSNSILRGKTEDEALIQKVHEIERELNQSKDELEYFHKKFGSPGEHKKEIANLQRLLNEEIERANEYCLEANEYCLEGLRAAKILHEALELPADKGDAIKNKIKQALLLIYDI